MRAPAWVRALRWLLLFAAAAAVALAFRATRGPAPEAGGAAELAARYVCPMHPKVSAPGPASCPICGMALVPARRAPPNGDDGHDAHDAHGAAREYEILEPARKRVFAQELHAPAAIDEHGRLVARLYRDDAALLAADEVGSYAAVATPDRRRAVHRTPDAPVPWDAATVDVRFELDESAGLPSPSPGEVGWLQFAARPREQLVVPYSAVLGAPDGPYVLVASADGRHSGVRRIEIGKVFLGLAAVVSGLADGERVVARDAFFVDAERRLTAEMPEAPGAGP